MNLRTSVCLPILAVTLLSGCVTPSNPPADVPVAAGDACGASRVQEYVGREPTSDVLAAIERESGAELIRRYNTGDPVTMDYRENRLNVEVGASGRIVKLSCG